MLQHPDQLKALKDESLVQGAISETLRYESSVKLLARYASEDIDLNGFEVKWQMVQFITSTAGMDPKMYDNPEYLI